MSTLTKTTNKETINLGLKIPTYCFIFSNRRKPSRHGHIVQEAQGHSLGSRQVGILRYQPKMRSHGDKVDERTKIGCCVG